MPLYQRGRCYLQKPDDTNDQDSGDKHANSERDGRRSASYGLLYDDKTENDHDRDTREPGSLFDSYKKKRRKHL